MSVTMRSSTTTAPARFLLLGDSHVGPVGRAAKAARIPHSGGPVGAGRDFFSDFFDAGEHDIFFRLPNMDRCFRGFLTELNIDCVAELAIPLISTIGFAPHFVATTQNWTLYRSTVVDWECFLSSPLFGDIVMAMLAPALAFYRQLCAFGLRVVAVMPPQRVPVQADADVFMAAQTIIGRCVAEIGVEVIDPRRHITDETGFQRKELCEVNDEIHGNVAWGRIVLSELLDHGL